MGRLKDKVAVVLGASSSQSIGATTARLFLREGATVLIAARNIEGLEAVASGTEMTVIPCDIRKEEDIEALAEGALTRFGRIDAAVNFAGANSAGLITEVSQAALTEACEINFIGATLFLKHMALRMNAGGSLIFTSSVVAQLPPAGFAACAGTKAGMDHVMRIAANELGSAGIRINAVAPGFMRTAATEAILSDPSIEPAFVRETPLGRLGEADDVARAALWLASDDSRSTTGQVIDVTSGQSLRRLPYADELTRRC